MNLALHGLLLQVIVSIVQFQHGFRLCSAGEPGYLDFDNLPETNFSCQGKVIGGYYADVEAGCQMFHVCTIGQKDEIMDIKFLCLNGTVFDQETRVCERVDEVDCSKSERFYNLNLELYGNNAVTLSLHESGAEDEVDPSELLEDHESQRTTSSRPSTTSSTTTTTPRPSISSTTSSSGSYQHPNGGYPQHFQPQPRFPSVQTSQSKSLYDDKNGGYHHQYIYHTGDHRNNNVDTNNDGNDNNNNNNQNHNNNNNQATSYQLFNNQGVSSTTGPPQIHQIRYSSTPSTQIQIHNDHQPTVSPIFHATSSTIQTLLNSNANSPALINPIFHNHGISSTTEQFAVHNNNPRETPEYRDDSEGDERAEEDRRPLEAIQPTTQGKVSKLTISPPQEGNDRQQSKNGQLSQQQRITTSFLPTPASDANQAVRSFYPTPRTSTKSSSSHVTHIHLPPPPAIPQLKPHQVTINLPPPDIQRIVQNPSPLLPSQSRVIVTAKASVSDESGRPLNSTQLVTLPLPTIPASYDDYKEGDESFDPFYRDVPKVRNGRRIGGHFRWTETRKKRSARTRRDAEDKIEKTGAVKGSTIDDEELEEKTAKEAVEKISDDEMEDKDVKVKNHLKTMTSKHRVDFQDKDEETAAIDTKESDEGEYVELDGKSKTVVDNGEPDAEEYVNAEEETFDSKIFEEPESQTSKEVEVRAVAQQDSKYSKDRSNRLDKDDKNSNSENSNSLGSSKRHSEEKSSRFSLALPEAVESESGEKHSSKKLNLKDDFSESEEKVEEELEEEMEEEISQENLPEDDYYYDADVDDMNLKSNEGDSAEQSKESPNKISSSKHEASRHSKSSKKILKDEEYYDLAADSTTQSNEPIFSYEMSGEYEDSGQNASPEDSREVQDDEAELLMNDDNTTQEFIDDTTTSTEQIESSVNATIKDDKKPPNQEDHLSEGVLKFTDEIPRSEKADEPEEADRPETVEETPQDYIDDNYEPQSYKEQKRSSSTTEITTTLNIAEDGNTRLADDKDNENLTTAMSPLEVVEDMEERQNDQAQPEIKTEVIEPQLEKSIEKPIESEEASTIATTTSITEIIPTTVSTTIPETTPTEVLTTTSTTTATTSTTPATITTTTPATTTTITPATTTTTTPATTTTTAPATTTTTPETTTTTSTTTPAPTTTTPATSTTTRRSTTSRPTPKLFKPFTIRKTYVYIPPTTTPIPVIIKPRLALLNPKPAKPIKSYNELAPKPIIRKTPLFARKALTTRTTTPHEIKNLEVSTEVSAKTTETSKIEEITLSLITTEVPTTQATESSTPVVTTLATIKEDENSSIKDNNVPISITDNVPVSSATESQTFTPYPILRMTEATLVAKKNIPEEKQILEAISTSEKAYVESNDVPNVSESENSSRTPEVVTSAIPDQDVTSKSPSGSSAEPQKPELVFVQLTSDSSILQNNVATNRPEMDISLSATVGSMSGEATTEISEVINRTPTLASIKAVNRRPGAIKRTASFNCLEKEMYRFYADGRDCRLFHYCSPGFTSRQVLDFRFVCEEGTAFDEETQSCIHDVKSPKCRKRVW